MSSFNFGMFGFIGVGVNFNPFSNSLISLLVNFLEDKFTICISVLFANGLSELLTLSL